MAEIVKMRGNCADAITGERIGPSEYAFDTGYKNKRTSYMNNSRNRVIKEATIVWLAEQAGYTVTKRDAGNSGDAKVVDAGDAESRIGEASVGKAKAGGKQTVKRQSSGTVKGK